MAGEVIAEAAAGFEKRLRCAAASLVGRGDLGLHGRLEDEDMVRLNRAMLISLGLAG